MGWTEYALAFAAFFLAHSLPVRPPLRARLAGWLGERGFIFAYSGLSLAMLVWLIGAAGRAPYLPLWIWAPWQNWVPLVAMLPACIIVTLAIGRPNPFSFGGTHNERFDPTRPGLVRWMRHPLLIALAIWASAHLVPNGDVAHVLLFGGFATFALFGRLLVDRRRQRVLGDEWYRLREAVAAAPFWPMPVPTPERLLRIGAGLVLYIGLLALHPALLGVDPLA